MPLTTFLLFVIRVVGGEGTLYSNNLERHINHCILPPSLQLPFLLSVLDQSLQAENQFSFLNQLPATLDNFKAKTLFKMHSITVTAIFSLFIAAATAAPGSPFGGGAGGAPSGGQSTSGSGSGMHGFEGPFWGGDYGLQSNTCYCCPSAATTPGTGQCTVLTGTGPACTTGDSLLCCNDENVSITRREG